MISIFFFFKQKTAYEMRISDWSSDVRSSDLLSTPSLVTLDNEEAKFSVGQEVPFLSGSYSNNGTSSSSGVVNPFQTIDRKDVGLTLSVTPQISEEIGRAHVCTPVTNAQIVCRPLLVKKKKNPQRTQRHTNHIHK